MVGNGWKGAATRGAPSSRMNPSSSIGRRARSGTATPARQARYIAVWAGSSTDLFTLFCSTSKSSSTVDEILKTRRKAAAQVRAIARCFSFFKHAEYAAVVQKARFFLSAWGRKLHAHASKRHDFFCRLGEGSDVEAVGGRMRMRTWSLWPSKRAARCSSAWNSAASSTTV